MKLSVIIPAFNEEKLLARAAGARVVFEPVNQIARARNAGARVAGGDWFLFVDADSWLHARTLADLLRRIGRGGVAGGGCVVGMEGAPAAGRLFIELWNITSRLHKWAAGCFVFCRADAFRDIGGFSTELYAAEEIQFSWDLKRWADRHDLRVIILQDERHVSSGRKFRLYSRGEFLRHIWRSFTTPSTVRDPKRLEFFYDGRR
jgi:glycosyltransferase involved in cell wall biosynthesis